MGENCKHSASFDNLPDELVIMIMSYFDKQHQFWCFGFLSQRFLKLMPCKLIEIQIDMWGNESVENKVSHILKIKELVESIKWFVVTLTSAKPKALESLHLKNRGSYTLIITKDNWRKENTLLTKTAKQFSGKCRHLKGLHFEYILHQTDEILNEITENQSNLEYLNLKNSFTITDNGIENATKHCRKLKKLNLSKCARITDSGIESISMHCQDVTHLDLTLCKQITNQGIKSVAQNSANLRCLILKGCEITDEGIEPIANGSNQLQKLDLTNCRQITDRCVEMLSQMCKVLEVLILEECFKLTDYGARCISEYGMNLEDLSLAGCHNLTDNTLKYLEQSKKLRTLDVRFCSKMTLQGISNLLQAVEFKALLMSSDNTLHNQFLLGCYCEKFSMLQIKDY